MRWLVAVGMLVAAAVGTLIVIQLSDEILEKVAQWLCQLWDELPEDALK